MKFLLLLLFTPLFGTSQEKTSILKDTVIKMRSENNLIHVKQGTPALILSNGAILARHSTLTLGKGSLPNGDYNYIATPSNSMEAKLKAHTALKQMEITEIKIKVDITVKVYQSFSTKFTTRREMLKRI